MDVLQDISLKIDFFFFLYLSSLSAFLQQVELSFLMPGLHPSALLDYEHLKSRDRSLAHLCVYLTLKKMPSMFVDKSWLSSPYP